VTEVTPNNSNGTSKGQMQGMNSGNDSSVGFFHQQWFTLQSFPYSEALDIWNAGAPIWSPHGPLLVQLDRQPSVATMQLAANMQPMQN
jgi:hypothetical protein